MRALLTCLLIGCASPAQAMNWEGHDDWMADLDPAQLLRDVAPKVKPPRPRLPADCAAGLLPPSSGNPYEQIPLPGHDCRAIEEEREVGR